MHDCRMPQALRLNPKNYKAMFRKAKAFKEQGYFEKAEKLLDEIIKDGEETGKTLHCGVCLGVVLTHSNRQSRCRGRVGRREEARQRGHRAT